MPRVLIIGGYGAFGAHAAQRLARGRQVDIIIAGRSRDNARDQARKLSDRYGIEVGHAALDAATATSADLSALRADVVINASGPFQRQDYDLARACIGAGCHYVDLADARDFVTGITQLDPEARAAGVCVVSGASSVPGLSSAVVQRLAEGLQRLEEVSIGISPGNSFDPGAATVASIVGQAGKPFAVHDRRRRTAYGWQGLHRHHFPEIGPRWMSDVDVPDLALLPQHYPELATARSSAGLEVGAFHLGLWSLSWLSRAGIVRDLGKLTGPLLALKRKLSMLGTDTGGMFVSVRGRDARGMARRHDWHLIARSGDGPYVPAIATVILARRLAQGEGPAPGAMPCFALFTLAEFEAEVADLDITCSLDRAAA